MFQGVSTVAGFMATAAAAAAHPSKPWGGEDSATVSPHLLAVADGVGSWREKGVDSGEVSRAFCTAAQEAVVSRVRNGEASLSGSELVQHCLDAASGLRGSSTFMAASFSAAGTAPVIQPVGSPSFPAARRARLDITHVGDCAGVVVRAVRSGGKAKMRPLVSTTPQRHGFNHPWQLGQSCATGAADAASFGVRVQPGDVVVLASDGVADNIFFDQKDLLPLLSGNLADAIVSGADSDEIAAELQAAVNDALRLAHERATDKRAWTPYSEEALNHAMVVGGKIDDATIVAGVVGEVAVEAPDVAVSPAVLAPLAGLACAAI